jgi:pimeloyl-ACP methyl ester carboxylesterase
MRREIALPTPLHAADLQFQAFAEFDGSKALSAIHCPTLVLTGDSDELIAPQNSRVLANLISGSRLVIIPDCGHRIVWEAMQECVHLITGFIAGAKDERAVSRLTGGREGRVPDMLDLFSSTLELFARWPLAAAKAGFDMMTHARQAVVAGGGSRFGDGKPIILVPHYLGSDLALLPLTIWLKALGYRPATAGLLLNLGGSLVEQSLSRLIGDITDRIGRKAVLITHSTGVPLVLRAAGAQPQRVSDIVILAAPRTTTTDEFRIHFIPSGWSVLDTMLELPRLLAKIGIELIEVSRLNEPYIPRHIDADAEERAK